MASMLTLYTFPQFGKQMEEFASLYDIQNILTFPQEKPLPLKHVNQRVCRFCSKDSTKTTFNNKSHIVPFFLGNKYGISDFECDECNKIFSEYENHLAYYLGLERTFSRATSRNGVPTLKSSKKDLEAREMTISGVKGIMIQKTSENSHALNWGEDGVVAIDFIKASYKPLYVYKMLLKIALCSLPAEEIRHYRLALRYAHSNIMPHITGIQNVAAYEFKLRDNPYAVWLFI